MLSEAKLDEVARIVRHGVSSGRRSSYIPLDGENPKMIGMFAVEEARTAGAGATWRLTSTWRGICVEVTYVRG